MKVLWYSKKEAYTEITGGRYRPTGICQAKRLGNGKKFTRVCLLPFFKKGWKRFRPFKFVGLEF